MENNCSYVLDTYVDVRLVAQALLVCVEQGIEVHGASELGRQCIGAIAAKSLIPVTSVQSALEILSNHGFSMKQLKYRGEGIRKSLTCEDAAPASPELEKRASEISSFIEGLSAEHEVFVPSEKVAKHEVFIQSEASDGVFVQPEASEKPRRKEREP